MSEPSLRLRFAPSPTGFLHVGGARTAIFNLLHARRHGGTYVLRIEDTDVERSRRHHAEQIVSSMQWLGLEWDEGPYYQSDRIERYRAKAEELIESGRAYRCYCSPEEIEQERDAAEKAGTAFLYSGKCRDRREAPEGAPFVVRLAVPDEDVTIRDLVRGDVTVDRSTLDDFILLRTDGNPTYHLSVVVDDIEMGINLVARGEDHLSNTPKHVYLFRAFGATPPRFAHLPLILGPDKKRLSKRTGATSVEEFRRMGILPGALLNFLTLLGWSSGDDRELFSRDELEELFDLEDVHRSAAVFDLEKLLWMNGHYLGNAPVGELIDHLREHIAFGVDDEERLERVVQLHQSQPRTLVELAEAVRPYFVPDDEIDYDEKAVRKHLKGDDLELRLSKLRDAYSDLDEWSVESTENALRETAEGLGVGAGKLIHPLRLAVTGKGVAPPIFDVVREMGKDRAVRRLSRLIEKLPELRPSS